MSDNVKKKRLLDELTRRRSDALRKALEARLADQSTEDDGGSLLRFRADLGGAFGNARQADGTGLVWEAVLIAPGVSLGSPRFFWTEEVLAQAAADGVFADVDINAYELAEDFFTHLPIKDSSALEDVKRYLAAQKVGWVREQWFEAGVGIKGKIEFFEQHAWLPQTLAQGAAAGHPDVLGLSIDARIRGYDLDVEGESVVLPTRIVGASSVDVVTRPAAGGKFLRAVAGLPQENGMKKFLAIIKEKRPDLLKDKDESKLTDDEIMELARMAMEAPDPGATKKPDDNGKDQSPDTRAAQGLTLAEVEARIAESVKAFEQRAACGILLTTELAESGLPDLARAKIRTEFASKVFQPEELTARIASERDYLAKMAATEAAFHIPDQARMSGGISMRDKVEMAVDQLFAITPDEIKTLAELRRLDGKPFFEGLRAAQDYQALEGLPRPTGIRELYVMLTGDTDINGRFDRSKLPLEFRVAQDMNSTTFSYALGNTLARRLVADYVAPNFHEELLVSIRKPVRDFRTQEAVMAGYYGDLDEVNPEIADYQEITPVTDEEATYALLQKGNILTITRKLIINDDITLVQRMVSRLGRAARRTHAKYVWAFWTGNGNCSDGTAWFTSPHGNLGANAMTNAYVLAAYTVLAKFTEKDSGERIGFFDNPGTMPVLVYPIDLMTTAEQIVNDDYYYASNDLTTKTRNPMKGKIRGQMVSLLTDANDWGLLLPPSAVDTVEMGYLNGRQEPEMFLADSPQAEQVFVADKIRYKIRHEYAGTVVDYRSGYKAIVT